MNDIRAEAVKDVPHNLQEVTQQQASDDYETRAKTFRQELEAIRQQAESGSITDPAAQEEVAEAAEPRESTDNIETDTETETLNDDELTEDLDSKTIPKKRLDKELKRRKELESQLEAERAARAKYEAEVDIYNKAMLKLQESKSIAKDVEPDLEPLDSQAHAYYVKQIKDLEAKLNSVIDNGNQRAQADTFERAVNMQAEMMQKTNPDFDDAYAYVIDKEKAIAAMIGVPEDKQEQYVLHKLQPIAHEVYRRGGNVAETVYNMARNYGFQSNTKKTVGTDNKATERNKVKTASALDDIPSAASSVRNDAAAITDLKNFEKSLLNKDGNGVDPDAFRKVLARLSSGR